MNGIDGQLNLWLDFAGLRLSVLPIRTGAVWPSVTLMRNSVFLAFAALGLASIQAAPASASVWDDARKVCLDRYNDEVKSGTVPNRMTKARYLNQCQASYVRTAKLEDELEEALGPNTDATEATVRDGQGGPELLPPAPPAQPKPAAPPRPAKPMPRFKPAN